MEPAKINLQIDELILHGFPVSDRHLISAAIQQELAKLFAERGVPRSLSQGGTIHQLDGGKFEMPAGTRADAMGAQIAQAIYGGLGE